jgi:DNA-binding NtrC family response regulator
MEALVRYDWPGNVRELENAIERAVVLSRRPQIDVDDLPEQIVPQTVVPISTTSVPGGWRPMQPMPLERALEEPERMILLAALDRNGWNRQATAAELQVNRTTLYKKMRRYGLDRGGA